MLSGENGILTKATQSKEWTERADAKEQAQLDILAWQSEKISKGENSDLNDSIVKGILTGKSYVKTANDTSFITANGGHEILYSDLYTKTTPAGPKTGESGYAGGYYDDPYIPVGFEHTGNDDWNSGYTIIGKAGTDNAGDEFVWVPCVLDQARVKEGDSVVSFGAIYTGKYALNGPPVTEWYQEQTGIDIKESVGKYGGFYISKYEAGIEGEKDNYTLYTEAGNDIDALTSTSTKPLFQARKGVWNYISRNDAKNVSENMVAAGSGVKSALVSGECWDTTLQWIVNTIDSEYDTNSTGKGNYHDNSSITEHITVTGSSSAYGINNIFDMSGNVGEWTSEYGIYSGDTILSPRGGYFYYPSSNGTAAKRDTRGGSSPGGPELGIGFRAVLYKE